MLQKSKTVKEISFEESDLLKSIQQLPDPRTRWTQHSLIDIVTIAIMAVLSGADDNTVRLSPKRSRSGA
jgi:hypothetical protein